MSKKKVTIGVKPKAPTVDQWVSDPDPRGAVPEPPVAQAVPMKRLTLDIPNTLHRAIKTSCAQRGVKMAEEIRALFEEHYRHTE